MRKFLIVVLATIVSFAAARATAEDAARGERDFRACAPCHSLEPDRNMTGPSLAQLWGRKAGSLPSFERYSDALKSSGIIWDDRSLDAWISDPQSMVPENAMSFAGIKQASVRADLLAFLKQATKPGAAPERTAQHQGMRHDGRNDGIGERLQSETSRARKAGQGDHLLSRHLPGDDCRWQNTSFLGAQSAPEDRFRQRWSAKWRTGLSACGHDGRSRGHHFCRSARDCRKYRIAMLIAELPHPAGVADAKVT